jgi:hypothetical protein
LVIFLQPLDNLNDFESVSFLLKGLGSDYDLFVTSVTTRVDPLQLMNSTAISLHMRCV